MAEPRSAIPRTRRAGSLPAFERLAPPPGEADVRHWVESRSAASDIVVELHGRGGWVARAAAEELRRGLALESMALTRLVAEVVLRPPDLRHLDAAFTAFVGQQRNGLTLREGIERDFGSRCANCGGPVIVEEFIWDGDSPAPSRRSYRCGHCRETRTGDGRTVPVDRADIAAAKAADGRAARARLIGRFPVPDPDHELPDQLLDLYTPRNIEALGMILERIEGDMRAPGIQAALRLMLVGMLLPASKLNSFPGRVAQPRIVAGRLRPVGDRQWRERNPWLLLEDSYRLVRGFVQRLETGRRGNFHARFGPDLYALRDGSANVVIREGLTLTPDEGEALADRFPPPSPAVTGTGSHPHVRLPVAPSDPTGRSRVRLVMTQPPVHWSPENLAFGYLATAIVLGLEPTLGLPLDLVFEPPAPRGEPRSEWARDAVDMRRALESVRPHMEADGTAVLLLDRQPSAAVVASVLGAVGAGFRLRDATFAEGGQEISGAVELTLPGGPPPVDRGIRDPAAPDTRPEDGTAQTSGPFDRDAFQAAIADLAVAVLQARGEPARYERLLGEVLLGLDRSGHLERVTALWDEPSARVGPAEASTERSVTGSVPPSTVPPSTVPVPLPMDEPPRLRRGRSWRDPARPVRMEEPVEAGHPTPSARPPGVAPTASASEASEIGPSEAAEPPAARDPVRITLDCVAAELHRADHPRLVEVDSGRWWLRDPDDIEASRPPLADRVEWAVFSLLSTGGGIPPSAFDRRIASMFQGHDAPDAELILACVDSYRWVVPDSDGLLQAQGTLQDRYQEHGELVATLSELGHRFGLRVWISPREQRRTHAGRPIGEMLSEVEQRVYLPLVTPGPADVLEQVDCIWYLRGKVTFLFEVEWTAMLSEPVLRRGAAIPGGDTVVRFLVIPAARTDLVRLKLERSPLLRARLEQDNWHILKAEHLRRLVAREHPTLDDLAPLLGLDPAIERLGEQLPLFG